MSISLRGIASCALTTGPDGIATARLGTVRGPRPGCPRAPELSASAAAGGRAGAGAGGRLGSLVGDLVSSLMQQWGLAVVHLVVPSWIRGPGLADFLQNSHWFYHRKQSIFKAAEAS